MTGKCYEFARSHNVQFFRLLARAPKPKPIVAVHPTHPNQPDTSKRVRDIKLEKVEGLQYR